MLNWFSSKLTFQKKDYLVRHLSDHKFFDKLPGDLTTKIDCLAIDRIWGLINTLPYSLTKSYICSFSKFQCLMENSVIWDNTWTEKEWLILEVIKNHNPKVFMNIITEKNSSFVEVSPRFSAENQNLPLDLIQTEKFFLVTPNNLEFLRQISALLGLCTGDNHSRIGPNHQKFMIISKTKFAKGMLTIYPRDNYYAISAQGNSHFSIKADEEMVAKLISMGLIKPDAKKVETPAKYFELMY